MGRPGDAGSPLALFDSLLQTFPMGNQPSFKVSLQSKSLLAALVSDDLLQRWHLLWLSPFSPAVTLLCRCRDNLPPCTAVRDSPDIFGFYCANQLTKPFPCALLWLLLAWPRRLEIWLLEGSPPKRSRAVGLAVYPQHQPGKTGSLKCGCARSGWQSRAVTHGVVLGWKIPSTVPSTAAEHPQRWSGARTHHSYSSRRGVKSLRD